MYLNPRYLLPNKADHGRKLGTPCTKVMLPSGDWFDTHAIYGSNKHSQNNKLADMAYSSASLGRQPGMISNLEIDYGNQSKDFKQFLSRKSNMQHDIMRKRHHDDPYEEYSFAKIHKENEYLHSPIKIEKVMSSNNKIDVLCVDDGSNSTSSIEVLDVKKPSANLELDSVIKKMHNRVLKCARRKLTKLIQEKMGLKQNKKQPTQDVSSIERPSNSNTIGLKSIIMTLEQTEKNGTNISVIRNVTNDGLQLVRNKSNDTLSSEEVLDRVSFYHEM